MSVDEFESIVSTIVKKQIDELKEHFAPLKRTDPYTKTELKDLFKVSMPTVDRWDRQGKLKRIKIGARVYYTVESVNEILK
jgi:hypothetical protein